MMYSQTRISLHSGDEKKKIKTKQNAKYILHSIIMIDEEVFISYLPGRSPHIVYVGLVNIV